MEFFYFALGIMGAWGLVMVGFIFGFGIGRYTEFKPWEEL